MSEPVCKRAIDYMRKNGTKLPHLEGFKVVKSDAVCENCNSTGANLDFENDQTIYTCWTCGYTFRHDDSRKIC